MNNYICTSFGFIKSITFNNEIKTHAVEYTNKLRDAHTYTSKSAKKVMQKYDIIGWIYNPYAEEHVSEDKYEVKQNKSYGYAHRDKVEVNEWHAVKVWNYNDSDARFLNERKLKTPEYMSFEEAQEKAIELNFKMLNKLQNELSKQIEVTKKNSNGKIKENNP